jgi:NTE family protein
MTRALIAPAAALLLAACASFPETPEIGKYEPNTGYRLDALERGRNNTDKLFVILTFSGGGTRAAALAYGVMEALRATPLKGKGYAEGATLLDEVDVISSVSGGSFTAAYYALRGEKLFDEFPNLFLYRKVQSELVGELLSPLNWPKLAGSSYGRSDLAADYYDRELFQGATYGDLLKLNKRPFVVLNATDMTTGTPFPFMQDQFDMMCSNMAGVRIARAVASSSAFPGLLTPLTYRNRAGSCEYVQPRWVQNAIDDIPKRVNPRQRAQAENRLSLAAGTAGKPERPYIHLTDGGVADNIGLRGPLEALSTTNHPWSVVEMMNNRLVDRLAVIAVNAATGPETKRDQIASVPGIIDNVITSAEVPLGNYSFDTLDLLRDAADGFARDARIVEQCKGLAAKKGEQCVLDIKVPHKVDFYQVQVSFDYIASPKDRAWFRALPTKFELDPCVVDNLREIGRHLLVEDPQFKKLLIDLGVAVKSRELRLRDCRPKPA